MVRESRTSVISVRIPLPLVGSQSEAVASHAIGYAEARPTLDLAAPHKGRAPNGKTGAEQDNGALPEDRW
jgi:hypothetical protein